MEKTFNPINIPFFMALKKNIFSNENGKVKKKFQINQPDQTNLSFSTQKNQVFSGNLTEIPLESKYSSLEILSLEPTIPIASKKYEPNLFVVTENTIVTRIGKIDYMKSQAIMLVSVSGMGLIIGILIALLF